jgi:hypothetical protein
MLLLTLPLPRFITWQFKLQLDQNLIVIDFKSKCNFKSHVTECESECSIVQLVVERRRKVSWNMIIGKLELHIILSYVMELLFFGIIGVLQLKRVTKLSRQQKLSLYMYCFSSQD